MIHVVTGATGNIGRRVVSRLLARGERPRVLVRDGVKARAAFGAAVDIVVGDLADEHALAVAFAGADSVFLVNSGSDLARRDALAAVAAKSVGVRRIVKLSSLGARSRGDLTAVALWHQRGEAAVEESGVPYVFVQSVGFMSNALAWAPTIQAEGVVRASTGTGKIAMIHPEDIADVAVEALVTDRYLGHSLAITGPELLEYAEMAAKIGIAAGRPVRFEPITDDESRHALLARGMPAPVAEALVTLWREVREGRVAVVTDTVQEVLGRRALSFDRWAAESASAFQ
jgi:uncharacterized protein YbjT (DUF2867 family)